MSINQINNITASNISTINNISASSIAEVINVGLSVEQTPSFVDTYAVSKSITTGSGQAVRIADDGGAYSYIQSDAFTISFWVKPGWNAALNTNVHFFSMNTGTSSSSNMIRIFYNENNNRVYFEYRSATNAKKYNFWLFHANSGNYSAAYSAAGLGSSYWSNTNRGNTGNDNMTMITIAKGSANNAGSNNVRFYWNGTDCGLGHYGANGFSQGTPSMSTSNRVVTVGSNSWVFQKCGNDQETIYNDLSIWNKQLSASEVSELWNSGARMDATGHSAAEDLHGYYKFENDGNDSSGNNHPAFTISGNSNIHTI